MRHEHTPPPPNRGAVAPSRRASSITITPQLRSPRLRAAPVLVSLLASVAFSGCRTPPSRAPLHEEPVGGPTQPPTPTPARAQTTQSEADGDCNRLRILISGDSARIHVDGFVWRDALAKVRLPLHYSRNTLARAGRAPEELAGALQPMVDAMARHFAASPGACSASETPVTLLPWVDSAPALLPNALPRPAILDDGRAQAQAPAMQALADQLSGARSQPDASVAEISASVGPPQHPGLRAAYDWIATNIARGGWPDPQRSLGTIGGSQGEVRVSVGMPGHVGINRDARFRVELAGVEHSLYARGYISMGAGASWDVAAPETKQACMPGPTTDESHYERCTTALASTVKDCTVNPCAQPQCPQYGSCQPVAFNRSFVVHGDLAEVWSFAVDRHSRAAGRRDSISGLGEASIDLCSQTAENLSARHPDTPDLDRKCWDAAHLSATLEGIGLRAGVTAVDFGRALPGSHAGIPRWLAGAAYCHETNCLIERPRTMAELADPADAPPPATRPPQQP